MAMGADLSKISSVDMVRWKGVGEESETGTRFISLETDLNTIRAKIVSDPAIKLVIIDPISNYMEKKSMNSDQEFRSILMPVVTMAQETGVSVIVIMHNSKQLGRDALGKIGGSLGGVGTARIAWTFMKKDGTEEYEMLLMKKNLGKFEGIRYTTESVDVVINGQTTSQAGMKFLGMSKGDADVAMAEADNFEAKRENAAAALIRTMLPSGGKVLVNDLFTAADNKGIAKRTMQKAISDLQLKSTGSKKHGLYYEWPESETPTASITGDPTVPF
jgi:RecA-family ATPase